MVERVGYDNVFAFRYSRRPGTPAATMADQVPDEVKADRNTRLLEVAGASRGGAQPAPRGPDVLPVLVDGTSKKNAAEAAGRTRCNRVVNFDARGRDLVGRVVPVRITRRCRTACAGSCSNATRMLGSALQPVPALQLGEGGATCGSR